MTGLTIPRHFTIEGLHPFDAIAWEIRDAVIIGKDGQPVFEARRVEFPAFWSQRATDIVASKYFRVVSGEKETSVKQMIGRIAETIGVWGMCDGYFASFVERDAFESELTYLLLHQYASFNSPVWFNVGVQVCPQTSACFILDVDDSMESILEWYRQEGMIFKGGSGSGVNLSKIRAKSSPLSGGGIASGVLSFARVADANAGAIKSGGATRRAAKLLVLDVDHPEIEEFIQCKVNAEKLAQHLMELGYGNGIEGEAYDQVLWQNANNSVSVPDEFMSVIKEGSGYELFHKIVKAVWECGDPGLFFKDTINAWHTTPSRGPIVSANPCGEFLRPPNEACNLASLNLLKFLEEDGSFNIPTFQHAIDVMITAMDILIDRSSYPTEAIGQNSKDFRPLGLGYCNLGALLMVQGLPYDSDAGRNLAATITALMTGEAYRQSARLALVKGAFAGFVENQHAMQDVVGKHLDAVNLIQTQPIRSRIHFAATEIWDAAYAYSGANAGYRNCQVSVLAPCGTISFMMDCDTTGIEPCLGLITTKKLVGGGEITMVNGVVERALRTLGRQEDRFMGFAAQLDAMQQMGEFLPSFYENESDNITQVFDCALGVHPISWQGHIKMVAAVQPFISGGISKTINMPQDATIEDVRDAYIMAWKLGLKAISSYRDGSKGVQPVTVGSAKGKALSNTARNIGLILPVPAFEEQVQTTPQRYRLPDERKSITHKFIINTYEGYLTVGLYDDGSPGELFVRMSKEGSTLGGLMDAWATLLSIALQYGVPLPVIVAKFKDGQYEPRGFTGNPAIRTASSITDYIVRWMELKFKPVVVLPTAQPESDVSDHLRSTSTGISPAIVLESSEEVKPTWAWIPGGNGTMLQHARDITGVPDLPVSLGLFPPVESFQLNSMSAFPLCSECGNMTIRNGSCCVCTVCGTTTGCS